jgi:uncharacterized protein
VLRDAEQRSAQDSADRRHVGQIRLARQVRLLPPYGDAQPLQAATFIAGLLVSPFLYEVATRAAVAQTVSDNVPLMIAGGLLVGVGAAVGGGCTSGHGVCGLSLFSWRSLVATVTFMVTGFATVFVTRHLIGA